VVYDESEDIDIENLPLEGRVLIKVLILSIDPYMRGRMNATASYTVGDYVDTLHRPCVTDK
jgi:NADPH-dependent curcumin reductase CurA